MSERMLDLLLRQWPGRTHLSAEETAKVLMQHPYTVRERMRNGELPGAVKRVDFHGKLTQGFHPILSHPI